MRGAVEAPKGLFLEKPSPLSFAKAIKNEAELAGMRDAHLRDSVALAETLHHLEQEVCSPHMHASEVVSMNACAWDRKCAYTSHQDEGLVCR